MGCDSELRPGNNSNVIANDCSMQSFVGISTHQPRKPTWSIASGSLPDSDVTCRDFRPEPSLGPLEARLGAGFGDEVRVATAGSETGEALLDISTKHPLADRVGDD